MPIQLPPAKGGSKKGRSFLEFLINMTGFQPAFLPRRGVNSGKSERCRWDLEKAGASGRWSSSAGISLTQGDRPGWRF